MLKADIAKRLKEIHPEFTKQDLLEMVDLVFETMAEALEEGRRIEIRGFGSFSIHPQKERCFINPKTGKETRCPSSYRIVFRPGKQLKEII
ncbi:MAG: integration host factor subunit beta [Thermodesulfobacteria bacterium]|nr:integration host factor subunit beta [Thermodesulfobacteriota bacterium]